MEAYPSPFPDRVDTRRPPPRIPPICLTARSHHYRVSHFLVLLFFFYPPFSVCRFPSHKNCSFSLPLWLPCWKSPPGGGSPRASDPSHTDHSPPRGANGSREEFFLLLFSLHPVLRNQWALCGPTSIFSFYGPLCPSTPFLPLTRLRSLKSPASPPLKPFLRRLVPSEDVTADGGRVFFPSPFSCSSPRRFRDTTRSIAPRCCSHGRVLIPTFLFCIPDLFRNDLAHLPYFKMTRHSRSSRDYESPFFASEKPQFLFSRPSPSPGLQKLPSPLSKLTTAHFFLGLNLRGFVFFFFFVLRGSSGVEFCELSRKVPLLQGCPKRLGFTPPLPVVVVS